MSQTVKDNLLRYMGIHAWRRRESVPELESSVSATQVELESQSASQTTSEYSATRNDAKGAVVNTEPAVETVQEAAVEPPISIDWQTLTGLLSDPSHCASCAQSTPILGDGDPQASCMIIFDAPSPRDSVQNQLLTGRAGLLFDAMLRAIGQDRHSIYLTTVFKCPPTEQLGIQAQCNKLVHHQIRLIRPKVIITFGEFAAQSVIKANEQIGALRAQPQRCYSNDIPIIPTFGFAELLRDSALKAHVWQDLKRALSVLA